VEGTGGCPRARRGNRRATPIGTVRGRRMAPLCGRPGARIAGEPGERAGHRVAEKVHGGEGRAIPCADQHARWLSACADKIPTFLAMKHERALQKPPTCGLRRAPLPFRRAPLPGARRTNPVVRRAPLPVRRAPLPGARRTNPVVRLSFAASRLQATSRKMLRRPRARVAAISSTGRLAGRPARTF